MAVAAPAAAVLATSPRAPASLAEPTSPSLRGPRRAPDASTSNLGGAVALAAFISAAAASRRPAATRRRGGLGSRPAAVARAVGGIRVEAASSADLRPAADIAVRSLKWTKGLVDIQLDDGVYDMLASNEVGAYTQCYMSGGQTERVMLVAKEVVGQKEEAPSSSPWFFGGGAASSGGRLVGCIGCEVKRYSPTGEGLDDNSWDSDAILAPTMADLAVSAECRGRGVAKKLITELEQVVQGWGYDELLLLVEWSNFNAIGVYDKLGYRVTNFRPAQVTSYYNTEESRISMRKTPALVMRKSLKPFPMGALENANWGQGLLLAAGGKALLDAAEDGSLMGALPTELSWVANSAASLQDQLSLMLSKGMGVIP